MQHNLSVIEGGVENELYFDTLPELYKAISEICLAEAEKEEPQILKFKIKQG